MQKTLMHFGLALAALNQANASVVHTSFGENGFSSNLDDFSGISFNPISGDVGGFNGVSPGIDVGGCFGAMFINTFQTFNTPFARTDVVANGSNDTRFLAFGSIIDINSSTWFQSSGSVNVEGAGFADIGQPGAYPFDDTPFYFGFRFQLDSMASDEFHYGYARVSGLSVNDEMAFTVYETAYNSTVNESISVGAVPEPHTAALLGLALGAGLTRRKRQRSA